MLKVISKQSWIIFVAVVSLSLLLSGCTSSNNKNMRKTTRTKSSEIDKTKKIRAKKIAAAKFSAAQYDYDRAIATLKEQGDRGKVLADKWGKEKEKLVHWKKPDQFPHLFFHSLIIDSQKAFHSQKAKGYKDYMVTKTEFEKSLKQLYERGYVLVRLDEIIKTENGHLHFKGVRLPKGKKPLILSQDDVSYYTYMKGDGFADRLIRTKNHQIKNVYMDDRKKKIGDYDLIPIVDSFVKKHPDFSYHGQKGTIALTGYNGVLGYRTSLSEYGNNRKTKTAIHEAKKVAAELKREGWGFASHSWGHLNMTTSSVAAIKQDNERWQREVKPIIGKTNVLIYPFGADINDWQPYTTKNPKFNYLKKQGFQIFCNVDATHFSWGQKGKDFYRNARINVDGIRMASDLAGKNKVLDPFFDVRKVYDKKERKGKEPA